MNKEQELRRCPFCGGEAVLDEFENDHIIGWFGRCLECNASMPYAISKPIAVKQWNRRSSDEQAEVVAWTSPEVIAAFATNPWITGMIWSSSRGRESSIPLYRAPPAVAAGGVTAEAIIAALKATEFHRSQIQGFYAKDAGTHYIRDCTKPHDQQRIWSARSNEGSDYDLMHSRMMERIELERWRIVLAALAVGDEGIREGWRPIETAPKDGTRILGSNVKGVSIMQWVDADPPTPDNPGLDAGWLSIDDGGAIPACPGFGTPEEMQPALWQPLPARRAAGQEER